MPGTADRHEARTAPRPRIRCFPPVSVDAAASWLLLRDVFVIVLIAVVVSFVIKTFLVRSFHIPSGSMEQTLLIKDRILVDRGSRRVSGVPAR